MSSIAGLFPPHSAFRVGACSSQYPILLAFSLFPSLNPAQTAGRSMVLSVYLVHHFHFPCPWVFAAPIFSMLVVYWVWHKLFYNVAHFPFPFCLPLFPRGTFPHRGGVQFRFTVKQPYIFALLMLKSNPLSHRIRVFVPEKLALFFVVSN